MQSNGEGGHGGQEEKGGRRDGPRQHSNSGFETIARQSDTARHRRRRRMTHCDISVSRRLLAGSSPSSTGAATSTSCFSGLADPSLRALPGVFWWKLVISVSAMLLARQSRRFGGWPTLTTEHNDQPQREWNERRRCRRRLQRCAALARHTPSPARSSGQIAITAQRSAGDARKGIGVVSGD